MKIAKYLFTCCDFVVVVVVFTFKGNYLALERLYRRLLFCLWWLESLPNGLNQSECRPVCLLCSYMRKAGMFLNDDCISVADPLTTWDQGELKWRANRKFSFLWTFILIVPVINNHLTKTKLCRKRNGNRVVYDIEATRSASATGFGCEFMYYKIGKAVL